jgi:hypothetical protein
MEFFSLFEKTIIEAVWHNGRSEVHMSINTKTTVFWDVTPSTLLFSGRTITTM